ncbi:sulfite exporter TauE/SafE family protein [Ramlibacter henchirensis]|uniref:sulfite exporter TauE/SafE family protein n=1 Tax=Ramlibacter henchirensis TaxID=204072 RepID=UPI001F0DDAB5|nr:sulfite exporter TauE/SafE family protein [Ramlibacter henchirensis]
MDAFTAAAVLLAGGLIGATGIGGVLVVPALTGLAGLQVTQAIAASALAFALPGIAALWWLARSGAGLARWSALLLGALPAAAAGAWAVHSVQAGWLLSAVGVVALFSGARGLWQLAGRRPAQVPGRELRPWELASLGAGIGLASALTGTGGPVLLVPLWMVLGQPLALTVAAAQVIQLPVALAAGAAHASAGALDVALALYLGVLLLAGSIAGQAAARKLPVPALQALVSVLLLAVGLWFSWRAAAPHFA